jgi:hypothetical protein
MIYLNLISLEQKKEIIFIQTYQTIRNIVVSLLIITLFATAGLLLGKYFLQNNFNDIVEQSNLIVTKQQDYNNTIKKINEEIKLVDQFQALHINWSKVLLEISRLTPDDVFINQLEIQNKDNLDLKKEMPSNNTAKTTKIILPKLKEKTVQIQGLAKTREAFLNFKQNLTDSPLFSGLESPFSNLLKEEDIKFTINAQINLDQLK